jgi:ABC-type dipeptide/oligopeptide/nickel transport system permease subunit
VATELTPDAAANLRTSKRTGNSPWADAMRRLRRNPIALASGFLIILMIFIAIFAPLLAPHAYDAQDRAHTLINSGDGHKLGTDNLGQDTLSRLIYGARVSLSVGVIVEAIELIIGVSLGLLAAYKGGLWDTILMRVTDAMFAFPDLLFAILLVGIIRPTSPMASFLTVFVALALVGWPGMARLVRGQALALREKEYVEAARSIGVGGWGIATRHLLPNMLSPIIVALTVDIAGIIMAEATLSFLGIGIQPPFPSWGRMISDARPYLRSQPMLLVYPSIALASVVLAFNFFGDALRDALDPRLRD